MQNSPKYLIVVVGPTAVGKTAIGIQLAKHFDTDVISCDSRQFYKELTVGTAKPTVQEMDGVIHHFINSHSIDQVVSAGDFEKECLSLLSELYLKKDIYVLVGGSGLFVKALLEGLDHFPEVPHSVRETLNARFEKEGILPLQEELKERDPIYFEKVDIHNHQRIIRALEVCIGTGRPFSSYLSNSITKRPFTPIKVGLSLDRAVLFNRINLRVDQMINNGLEAEVQGVSGYQDHYALRTVGYQELFDFFQGKTSKEKAIELIKRNTRRYAKRQLTWFKKDEETKWFAPSNFPEVLSYIKKSIHTK